MAAKLRRIPLIHNKNYKPSGIKSYVYLLRKYNIAPTKEGPYFVQNVLHQQGKFGSASVGGKARPLPRLRKRKHHHHHHREGGGTDPSTGAGSGSGTTPGTGSGTAPGTAPGTGSGTTPGTGSGTAPGTGSGTAPAEGETGEVTADDQQNDSLYICPVQIGTPAQTLHLDFDTGSADLWVWSTSLPSSVTSQGGSSHTIFDPSKSSTFQSVSDASWQISYGDNSSASGTVGTDNISLGGLVVQNQDIELANNLSSEFVSSAGDGLLGLAWGSINTVKPGPAATPVENMITQGDIPQTAELFTAYLGSWRDAAEPDKGESFYTFGFIDQDVLTAAGAQPSYTPVDNSQGFWQFASASMTINGTTVQRSGNTAIADTGTTLALVSDDVVEQIYAAIPGSTYDSSQQGYIFPTSTTADSLPTVTFAVGDQQFAVQKEALAFADAGNNMVFGGIQSRGSNPFDILGDTFLKGIYAIFDQGNTRFGAVQRVEQTQNLTAPPTQASS